MQRTLRTLNVFQHIPGITDSLQINIAYEGQPGLKYSDAKAFERNLETKIQALLLKIIDDEQIRFIPIAEALEITKHPNASAFSKWKLRHNARHPHAKVITRPGLVELNSLQRAIQASAEEVAA